jgi:hypothetical protein
MGGVCSAYRGEERYRQGFGWGNLSEKRQLERPRRKWVDNIKMGLQEVGCEGMDWIDLA